MKQIPNMMNKAKREILEIRGINYTNSIQDGDLADCKNISASKYPYITTAKEKSEMTGTGYENVKGITSHRYLITFANDKMYIDGVEYTDIPSNEKQTAISTGKMFVLPDDKLITLEGEYQIGLEEFVSDKNKFIAQLLKHNLYPIGSSRFYSALHGNKTVTEINAKKYELTNKTYYYRISEGGTIMGGADDTTELAEVKNGDVIYLMYGSTTSLKQRAGLTDLTITDSTASALNTTFYKYARETNSCTFYRITEAGNILYGGTNESSSSSFPVSVGDIVGIRYSVTYHFTDVTVYCKEEPIKVVAKVKTVEEMNDINGMELFKTSTVDRDYTDVGLNPSNFYYLYKISNSGDIKYYSGTTEYTVTVAAGDIVQAIFTSSSRTLYHKSACDIHAKNTPESVMEDVTLENENWLCADAKKKYFVITNLDDWGVHLIKGGSPNYVSVSFSLADGISKSLSSIDAKYLGTQTIDGYLRHTYNKNFTDFVAADDTISIVDRNDILIKTVTAVGSGQNKYYLEVSDFAPNANWWYSFKKLENPDFACEWQNRLWCCNSDAKLIYASEQGKPDSFLLHAGEAGGSYSVTIGDVDAFTGMCKYESSILFFKQNRIYKILGSSPKNYELYSYETEGVKLGCHKSLCTINGVLYYVGLHGVYAYSGGAPVLVSSRLGNMEMNNAVGGTDGERYFLSFDSNGKSYMFVFEPKYKIWMLYDNIKAVDFARSGDDLYYLDASDSKVYMIGSDDTADSTEWYAQFTPFYETVQGKKRYTKLIIRYELGKKSHISVKIRQDGGKWQEVGKLTYHDKNGTESFILPIMRCDKFELRLEGKGKATILEILREFEVGSDM